MIHLLLVLGLVVLVINLLSDEVQSNRLLKNSVAPPILGGAALQRCDKWAVLNSGFSRRVYFWRAIRVFQ
jgi:hypothetical protein